MFSSILINAVYALCIYLKKKKHSKAKQDEKKN